MQDDRLIINTYASRSRTCDNFRSYVFVLQSTQKKVVRQLREEGLSASFHTHQRN